MNSHRLRNYRIDDNAAGAYHYFGQASCVTCQETIRTNKPDCLCLLMDADQQAELVYHENLEQPYVRGA